MPTRACPRHVGTSYRLTIRTSERRFFLTPTPEMMRAVGFCLTRAVNETHVQLHSISVMGNHVHIDFTDVGMPLPRRDGDDPDASVVRVAAVEAFIRRFKSLLGRRGNAILGRWEPFWAPKYSLQEVETVEAAKKGMVYTICNPSAAGLVAFLRAYPGILSRPSDLPTTEPVVFGTFKKPEKFFRPEALGGEVPDTLTLMLWPHPLAKDDPEGFKRDIVKAVKEQTQAKRAAVKAAGRRFKGAAAVMATSWQWAPKTKEPRRELNPTVAEPNPNRRWLMIARNRWFKLRYAKAMKQWRLTGRAVFPAGTTKMRGMPGVTIEPTRPRMMLASDVLAPMRC